MSASSLSSELYEPAGVRYHWSMPVKIRWTDLDALGHVHHLAYLRWCEDARNEHAVAMGLPVPGSGNRSQVVVSMKCDFSKPIERGSSPVVHLSVTRVGRTSLETLFVILVDGLMHFRANVTTVMCDDNDGRPSPWTPVERDRLLAGLESP